MNFSSIKGRAENSSSIIRIYKRIDNAVEDGTQIKVYRTKTRAAFKHTIEEDTKLLHIEERTIAHHEP